MYSYLQSTLVSNLSRLKLSNLTKNNLLTISVNVSHGTETGLNRACFEVQKVDKI